MCIQFPDPSRVWLVSVSFSSFFFNAPPTPEIYTLSLHDALPIYDPRPAGRGVSITRSAAHVSQVRASDRKSTRLNSSHVEISYAVFCLKKKTTPITFLTC